MAKLILIDNKINQNLLILIKYADENKINLKIQL